MINQLQNKTRMKIGLLLCDHVRDEFLDIQGDYPEMFATLLPAFEWEVFEVCRNQFPENAMQFDAYLVTGSRFSVYHDLDWIVRLKVFVNAIQKSNKKYVGICFGHQLLAEALGGKVEKAAQGWSVGVHTFNLLKHQAWMQPNPKQINLLMMCQDQVQVLPTNSQVLATTEDCPVGIFMVGKQMLGIQAHPEFSKAYDQALMEARVDRMGIETVQTGIQSLKMPIHQTVISQWITQFLLY